MLLDVHSLQTTDASCRAPNERRDNPINYQCSDGIVLVVWDITIREYILTSSAIAVLLFCWCALDTDVATGCADTQYFWEQVFQ